MTLSPATFAFGKLKTPFFERGKIGIHNSEFIVPLSAEFHRIIHGKGTAFEASWNGRWDALFTRYPNASRKLILLFLKALRREFGV